MASNQKKAKIFNGDEDFASVREYLMKHELGPKHPAIVAALWGMDEELRRIERDRKLHAKFNATGAAIRISDETDDFSRVDRPTAHDVSNNNGTNKETSIPPVMADDWHDVSKDDDADCMTDSNEYGTFLAQRVVQALTDHSVMCRTALGAVTAALHATLLDRGFACTGIPPKAPSSTGFAPPVRQIKHFLPLDWEANASNNSLTLRYRKTNAIELHTILDSTQSSLKISLGDIAMTVDCLEDHFNLKSWSKATQNGSKLASPTLHFKSLAKLLGEFAQRFDFGESTAPFSQDQQLQIASLRDNQIPPFHQTLECVPRHMISQGHSSSKYLYTTEHDPLRMPTQPSRPFTVGAGDLFPTGLLQYPNSGTPGVNFPNQPGNLVGPNHPMFLSGGSGMMQPRYDPVGPPGGPTELNPSQTNLMLGRSGRLPPGGTGNPNNDLAKQPQFGHNNMFL